MMDKKVDLDHSISMAVRHPRHSAILLAKSLSSTIDSYDWININLKTRFCVLLLKNIIRERIDFQIDERLIEKVRERPLVFTIRLLKRKPDEGLKALVALITEELQQKQHLNVDEQLQFYTEIFNHFFPEIDQVKKRHE